MPGPIADKTKTKVVPASGLEKAPPASSALSKRAPADLLASLVDGEETRLLSDPGLDIALRGVISTQCASIDRAIGRGGVPLGRLTILHGAEGSGKTTLLMHLIAEVQRMGGVAMYIDKEYKLDPDYAEKIGVDRKSLVYSAPKHLEGAFEVMSNAIKKIAHYRKESGKRTPILVSLDSMNAAITKAQVEGDWEDNHMAAQARKYSELIPKLIPEVSKEDVALVWVSQVRKKMNVMFGDDNELSGGQSARFYASLIMYITRMGAIKDGDGKEASKIANKVKVECKKNQIAPPFKSAEIEIIYGHGINKEAALLDVGEDVGVITKSGNFFVFGGEKIGLHKAGAIEALRKEPALVATIMKKIAEAEAKK